LSALAVVLFMTHFHAYLDSVISYTIGFFEIYQAQLGRNTEGPLEAFVHQLLGFFSCIDLCSCINPQF